MSRAWIVEAMVVVLLSLGCGGSSSGGGDEDNCPAGTTMQVYPETITVVAESAGFDAIGGLSNGCPAMVQWTLSGPGTLSSTSGIPIHYTPPATVASTTTATLTATAAGLVDTFVVTITSAAAASASGHLGQRPLQHVVPLHRHDQRLPGQHSCRVRHAQRAPASSPQPATS
jgi:hypothetical protein